MARFAQISQGFRAIKVIELPITTAPHGEQRDTPEQASARDGAPAALPIVGVRALMPGEREDVLCAAQARAVKRGITTDLETSPVYNQALAVYTVAMACVDPDSDRRAPVLYFGDTLEDAAEAIRTSPLLTDDIVLYLRERQECWQDEIHPQALSVKDSEMLDFAQRAVADADFLSKFRLGTLVNSTRFMAALWLSSLEGSLPTSTSSEKSTTPPSTPPASKPLAKTKGRRK